MASGDDLRRGALNLEGTTDYPHFDRVAFKRTRTYVTLAPDGLSANFRFSVDAQAMKCLLAPDIFSPVKGNWGRQGWTTANLAAMRADDLIEALALAYVFAAPGKIKKSA